MLSPFYQNKLIEAGCDEAGRGCLAGPVYAAAVILPAGFHHPLLNDSKQVSEAHRKELRQYIEEKAITFGVASIDNVEIDTINILKASFKAVHTALDKLKTKPGLILMDGNRFIPYKKMPHQCIIKGDALFQSIAAASILAKTYRDEFMLQLHQQYPHYGWDKNKGYGTAAHRQAIAAYGQCEYHRKSFKLKEQG
jgi:ribonuclease HII